MFAGSHLADRYELIERVAEGGMGEVWRARQIALEREVAIKVLHPLHRVSSPDLEARFKREAEIVGKISHRNVISIIDFGTTPKGDQFLVMPFLHGETLEARMKAQPPPLDELLRIARGVLSGLAAIHDVGVVHRDLKPANVFLARDADGMVPKLLDFGISRDAKREGTMLTQDGTVMGTPHYMAPEQFESARTVDHRADLFSLGAILYEAIGGRTPYVGADAFAVFRAVLESTPPNLKSLRQDVAPNLAKLVHDAIAKSPDDRFQSARDMRDAVDRVLAGEVEGDAIATRSTDISTAPTALAPDSLHSVERVPVPPSKRRVWPWALGLVLVGAGTTAAIMAWPEPLTRDPTPTEPVVVETDRPDVQDVDETLAFASVAKSGSLRSLSIRYARLPPELRARVVGFAPRDDDWLMLTAPEDAAPLVERFGNPAEGTELEPTLQPKLMHTTALLAVRQRASVESPMLRSIPHGTLVVALYGDVTNDDGEVQASTPTATGGAMTHVVVSASSSGWSSTRLLEEESECMPLPAGLVRNAPREMAASIRQTHTIARTQVTLRGVERTVFMAAGYTRARTIVTFYAPQARCGVGETLATVEQAGALDELFLTDRNGDGETMLVLSTVTSRRMRQWEVWPLATPATSVWSRELATAAHLEEGELAAVFGSRDNMLARHDGYALMVRDADRRRVWLSWDGSTLSPAPAPRRAGAPRAPQLD